ncbi:MAG: T9SS type A sorting domain-containing protein [Bacteroidetes bacterium]|nr:T9SS type A sorting domain-containing protein [Bacteroidota bacterium]
MAGANVNPVKDIYYSTVAIGNGDDVAGYETTLLSIAQLCPLSDGPAVYHARALYSLIDPDQDYDDDITCVQNGYYFRMQQGINRKSSVFPNPTSGEVTIVCLAPENTLLEILDICGKVCFQSKLNSNSDSHVINLSRLENGMYTYRLMSQDVLFDMGKIIINK